MACNHVLLTFFLYPCATMGHRQCFPGVGETVLKHEPSVMLHLLFLVMSTVFCVNSPGLNSNIRSNGSETCDGSEAGERICDTVSFPHAPRGAPLPTRCKQSLASRV